MRSRLFFSTVRSPEHAKFRKRRTVPGWSSVWSKVLRAVLSTLRAGETYT